MRKAILTGLLSLATVGGLVLAHPASAAYSGAGDNSCAGSPAVTIPGSGSIYVNNGDEVVCANGFSNPATQTAFDGGALRARTGGASNGRLCAGSISQPVTYPASAYVIADGDSDNAPQGQGYIGLSNYESGGTENCTQGNNSGGNTNSGGAVAVDNEPNLPIPLLVCGSTSGTDYDVTGRDGCYLP
jgi:hypothetical protein